MGPWGLSSPTSGLEVQTGDPDNPVVLDYRGTPLIAVSAEHVLLDIGEFVHVSGAFSFRIGEVETVDVNTGIVSDVPVPTLIGLTNVTDTDDGTLGRTTDFSMIWNLRVNTIKIGAEGVSVFIGTGWPTTTSTTTSRTTTAPSTWTSSARVRRASSSRTSTSAWCWPPRCRSPARSGAQRPQVHRPQGHGRLCVLVGFEDVLELTIRTVTVEVNMGTVLVPSAPATVIDWQLSYPDTGGYEAPTAYPPTPS